MKRLLSAALTFSLLASQAALAQPSQFNGPGGQGGQQYGGGQGPGQGRGGQGPGDHGGDGREGPGPMAQGQRGPMDDAPGLIWHRGDHFDMPPDNRYVVDDWHHYPDLYAPPYGYQWVQYDGQFMLIAIASGMIASILMGPH